MKPSTSPRQPGSRQLAINFLLLAGGEFLAKVLTFFAFSHLARTLGPQRYGSLEFVLAVMVFFTLPVDFGLGSYGAREIAKNEGSTYRLLREIVGMRTVLSVCSFLALLLFLTVMPRGPEEKQLLGVYGLSLLIGPMLLQWFFQAHDKMHWVACTSIVRQLVFALSVIFLFHPGIPVLYVGFAELASVAAAALFCLVVTGGFLGYKLRLPSFSFPALFHHFRQATPIGITELAWAFMWYFATVLLGLWFADQTLGWFGASHRLLMALHTFVWLYFFNLLPSISRCVGKPVDVLLTLMGRSMKLAVWSAMFGAFLLTTVAKEILVIAYGSQFAGASASFSILVWMLPVAMLSGHHRFILIAYNHQSRLLYCTAVSGAAAIVLGILLVPPFGSVGAAWALLAANSLNFVMAYIEVKRHVVEVPFFDALLQPLQALALAYAAFLITARFNVWIGAATATAVYGICLLASQGAQVRSLVKLLVQRQRHPVVAGTREQSLAQ